jgi:hypothetical protein
MCRGPAGRWSPVTGLFRCQDRPALQYMLHGPLASFSCVLNRAVSCMRYGSVHVLSLALYHASLHPPAPMCLMWTSAGVILEHSM